LLRRLNSGLDAWWLAFSGFIIGEAKGEAEWPENIGGIAGIHRWDK